MRKLRDDYVAKLPDGPERIADYYASAPALVAKIDARTDASILWRNVYADHILPIAELIERGDHREAMDRYYDMQHALMSSADAR